MGAGGDTSREQPACRGRSLRADLGDARVLGHIDRVLASQFGAGMLAGNVIGSRLAQRVQGPRLRKAFGWLLVLFGLSFTAYRLLRS
jgi:uncharacterized membrane protein YfcA